MSATSGQEQAPYPAEAPYERLYHLWEPPRAKVVVKRDLIPAVSVLSFVALLGMAIGWLWSRLAPGVRLRVREDGLLVPLQAESYHRFDDLVLLTLFALAAGVVTGVAVWFMRERRGPVIMIAAVLGGAVAAWLAVTTGVSFAEGRFAVDAPPKIGDIVTQAPRIESYWPIVAWPMTTALAYGLLAAWNGRDDLGRRLG
ncbi:uncharacterized protein DUF2567 [Herbihabitans rhizosphaerae]|uniref:Uncharacterized protein DUF2567 n=1 Tax=Herbihabitans rhizosphaerae TaxID=1872711 RepID=A0A4Q7KIU6_9PSEU|nr:DUF2567 domain-containing protein [Herbihabitans rhizosphaerae]RZS34860.1 uncharacterized protein DUF2567 [Herbihabitans rhizosphaerae]